MAQTGGQKRLPNELLAELARWVSVLKLFTAGQLNNLTTSCALLNGYLPRFSKKDDAAFGKIIEHVKKPRGEQPVKLVIDTKAKNGSVFTGRGEFTGIFQTVVVKNYNAQSALLFWLLRLISTRTGRSYIVLTQGDILVVNRFSLLLNKRTTIDVYPRNLSPLEKHKWDLLADWLTDDSAERGSQHRQLVHTSKFYQQGQLELFIDKLSQRFLAATKPSAFAFRFNISEHLIEFERFNTCTGEVLLLKMQVEKKKKKAGSYLLQRRPNGEQQGEEANHWIECAMKNDNPISLYL